MHKANDFFEIHNASDEFSDEEISQEGLFEKSFPTFVENKSKYSTAASDFIKPEAAPMLICTDFDKTLQGDDNAMETFLDYHGETLKPQGIELIIATGRSFELLESIISSNKKFEHIDIFITENGSEIYRRFKDEAGGDRFVKDEMWDTHLRQNFDIIKLKENCEKIGKMKENPKTKHNDLNLHFIAEEKDHEYLNQQLENLLNNINVPFRFALCRSSINNHEIYVDINHADSGKGNALSQVAFYLGIPMEATIAFGDSLNDVDMLLSAGRGFIVANCCEMMKNWLKTIGLNTKNKISISKYEYANALLEEMKKLV